MAPPVGLLAEPAQVSGLMLFLGSDLVNVTTGSAYPIDGGCSAD